ncbi:MAG: DUF255 domain-containing protein [Planctomycetales bacterium]|nr:DUF255 domain-containing protein [Planctomycetales bacterium]
MSPSRYVFWIAMALACGTALAGDEIRWAPNLPSGRQAASQFNVPLLVHFYGDNCLPCRLLEQRVYTQQEAVSTLNKYFICVHVNATQEPETAREFGVHSWPTDVFLSPDGKTLYQGVCPQDLSAYLDILRNVAVMNRDRNVMLAAQKNPAQQHLPSFQPNSSTMLANSGPVQTNVAPGMQSPSFYSHPQTGLPADTSRPDVQVGPAAALNASAIVNAPTLASQQQLPAGSTAQWSPNGTIGVPSNLASYSTATMPTPNMGSLASNPTAQLTASLPQATMSNVPAPAIASAQPQLPPSTAVSAPVTVNNPHFTGNRYRNEPQPGSMAVNPSLLTPGTHPAGPGIPPGQYLPMPATTNNFANGNASMMASNTNAAPYNSVQMPMPSGTAAPGNLAGTPSFPNNFTSAQASPAPQFQQPLPSAMVANTQLPTASLATHQVPSSSNPAVNANTVSFQPRQSAGVTNTPALSGQCPVTLKHQREWKTGDPRFAVKHRGRVYWMSSQEAMQEFLSDPDGSSPVMAGYDPLIFLQEGRLVDGDIRYGWHEGNTGAVYLFSSQQSKQQYQENFEANTRALETVLNSAGAH